jgi:L-arabinose isomerase
MAEHQKRPKIGLYSGGIQHYWTETGMKGLRELLEDDIRRLVCILEKNFAVAYPGFAANAGDSEKIGRSLREEQVEMALMYHATYLEDEMSLAFLDQLEDIFPVLFHSQGTRGLSGQYDLINAGRSWGNNSIVQLPGTLKRLRPNLRFGYVFGNLDDASALEEIREYAWAARAVKKLRGRKVAFLPHRSSSISMYDTFPDEAMMMAQTRIKTSYLYVEDLITEMKNVPDADTETLARELYQKYEVIEPSEEEIRLAAKQSIALERLIGNKGIDALAIDTGPGLIPYTGMIPCIGMDRLIDQGVVVSTEGDLGAAVSGLILRELTGGKPIQFWEHLAFDDERNWILGGHEGGSAGFTMAKANTRPRLRNTQYVDFGGIPGAPHYGVVPEFITAPGPVTLLTLFRGPSGYEMRLASGESVDIDPLPVHYEHTVFKPNIPLKQYFKRIAELGVCHHFAVVYADVSNEVEKVAEILGMKLQRLT